MPAGTESTLISNPVTTGSEPHTINFIDKMAILRKRRIPVRTVQDLEVACRKVAEMFETPVVCVMGSQAVLNAWGNKAPDRMRTSGEIDLYPGNYKVWEEAELRRANGTGVPLVASEHIFAIAGEGSCFEELHGFYLDGIDAETSPMPTGWQERANYREITNANGTVITVVSPSIEDTMASKMIRLAEKDVDFVTAAYDFRPFDVENMKKRLEAIEPFGGYDKEHLDACRARAFRFLDALPRRDALNPHAALVKQLARILPEIPEGTHCAFYNLADNSITVRKWDPDMGVYYKIDNPLGPAMIAKGFKHYVLDGVKVSEADWEASLTVHQAKAGEPTGEIPPWKTGPR